MDFKSTLAPKQIEDRLSVRTQKFTTANAYVPNLFLSKTGKNGAFTIWRTHSRGNPRGLPFVGRIEQRETGSTITGKFRLPKAGMIVISCFFAMIWIVFSVACFFNPVFDVSSKLFMLGVLILFTVGGYAFFNFFPKLYSKTSQMTIVAFIEENLLQ